VRTGVMDDATNGRNRRPVRVTADLISFLHSVHPLLCYKKFRLIHTSGVDILCLLVPTPSSMLVKS